MIRITKQERQALEKVGLVRYRKQYGYKIIQDSNLVVTNREHIGKNSKTYYIVEEPVVMRFLGYYDGLNMQKINESQYQLLLEKGLLNENKIQHWGEYKPGAICFENQYGERRIMKVTQLMLALNLWKTNKQKREAKKANSSSENNCEEDYESMENYTQDIDFEKNEFAEMLKNRN